MCKAQRSMHADTWHHGDHGEPRTSVPAAASPPPAPSAGLLLPGDVTGAAGPALPSPQSQWAIPPWPSLIRSPHGGGVPEGTTAAAK